MAHWAKIENGYVVNVIVTSNDDPDEGLSWIQDNLGGQWVKTSYNTRGGVHYGPDGKPDDGQQLNYNYAGIGMLWDGTGFYTESPFPSWALNKDTYLWEPPIPAPTDGKAYVWNEKTESWDLIEVPK